MHASREHKLWASILCTAACSCVQTDRYHSVHHLRTHTEHTFWTYWVQQTIFGQNPVCTLDSFSDVHPPSMHELYTTELIPQMNIQGTSRVTSVSEYTWELLQQCMDNHREALHMNTLWAWHEYMRWALHECILWTLHECSLYMCMSKTAEKRRFQLLNLFFRPASTTLSKVD